MAEGAAAQLLWQLTPCALDSCILSGMLKVKSHFGEEGEPSLSVIRQPGLPSPKGSLFTSPLPRNLQPKLYLPHGNLRVLIELPEAGLVK
jgi:hypothetical protein